jgi:3-keto steroid reductase
LTLIFTTRSSRKGSQTHELLQNHIYNTSPQAEKRIHLRPENLELTRLLSVKALAEALLTSEIPRLDAIILNAGIGGWTGLNWPYAVQTILADPRRATTWPKFKLGAVGLVTEPQLPARAGQVSDEPPLAQVFCANVFGHYMLAHWLMPLLCACPSHSPAKVVWVSSLEPSHKHYKATDHQGFRAPAPYEHSKRITDYLALTSNLPAVDRHVIDYTTPEKVLSAQTRAATSRPTIHVTHPGILTTTIIDLYWILQQGYLLAIYLARLLGSPWATVTTYPAAISAVWVSLVSRAELNAAEKKQGGKAIKWGSAIDRSGSSRVEPTDVPGWGYNGSGKPFADTWWGGPAWWNGGNVGRDMGAEDPTKEDVENFIVDGVEVWEKMEELRIAWEKRLEAHEKVQRS